VSEPRDAPDANNVNVARRTRRPGVIGYVGARFPLKVNGLPTALTFVAMQLTTAHLVGFAAVSPLGLALGFITFVLLFFQLRLIDDIDDFDRDQDVRRAAGTRSALFRWLVAGLLVMMLVNLLTSPHALVLVGVATALAAVAPVLAKRPYAQRHPALLFVLYESAPASIMFYGCTGPLPTAVLWPWVPYLIVLALPFWCGYQAWKMSRKLDRTDYRPYTLAITGRLRATAVFFTTAALAGAVVAAAPGFPLPVAVCFVVVPALFLAGLVVWYSRTPSGGRSGSAPPRWSGFTFVLTLEALLIATSTLVRL
jgi:hypothetical protein